MNRPQAAVQHVLRLNPAVRLLAMVRDPVERSWSQIRMHVKRGQENEDLAALGEQENSLWPYLFYSDYAGSLRRWSAAAAPGQLLLMLHDEVRADPWTAIARIYSFGGLALPAPDFFADLTRDVFRGESIDMPPALRARLLKILAPQYDYLRAHFPEAVTRWLAEHRSRL